MCFWEMWNDSFLSWYVIACNICPLNKNLYEVGGQGLDESSEKCERDKEQWFHIVVGFKNVFQCSSVKIG